MRYSAASGEPYGLHDRFRWLDQYRAAGLARKREHASVTLPHLLPPQGKAQNQALEVPYSSTPAALISALASRIVSVVFPLNNQPIFQLLVDKAVVPEGEDTTDMEAVMGRFERSCMDQLGPTNLRAAAFLAYKHLITIGDCLILQMDDLNCRVFRIDQYVVKRKHEGEWMEIIIQESINPAYYPALERIEGTQETAPNSWTSITEHWEPLYTCVKRNLDNSGYTWKQEFRGKSVGSGEYLVSPYIPMRWNAVAGEDYGQSLIEDLYGDVRCLDSLSKALIDGALLNAEYRWGVNPGGITELQDLLDSVNGDFVAVGPADVFPLQFQNAAQVGVTLQAVQHRESIMGQRFLSNQQAQPKGERVTARIVALIAEELEQQLGGLLSQAAREFQDPIIRRTLLRMAQKELVPPQIQEYLKPDSILKIRITAGLEILNREAEREKLDQAIVDMRNLPDQALRVFEWTEIGRDWWESKGLESAGRIKTRAQLAAEDQAAMAQQQALMYQEGAIKAGVAGANAPPQSRG